MNIKQKDSLKIAKKEEYYSNSEIRLATQPKNTVLLDIWHQNKFLGIIKWIATATFSKSTPTDAMSTSSVSPFWKKN